MAEQLNKIQLRAEILTILSKLQANCTNVSEIIQPLEDQENKKDILDILKKELLHSNEQKATHICFLMLKFCEKIEVETVLWDTLRNLSINDSIKAIILDILKDLGNKIEYEKLEEFFENPADVIDADTQQLLQTAIINPEAQIDFLDFISSLPNKDKRILVESLGEDYSNDSLANILNPVILYDPASEIGKVSIDILGTTKSQLALHTLEEAREFVDDTETALLIKKNISKLKISGVREDNSVEFYRNILSSKPYFSYASYPDGHGNQAIIFSRIRENETIQLFAVVMNDSEGLIDCFGFNEITKSDFERIVDKFYNSSEHVYINPSVIKSMLFKAEILTRQRKNQISYEYICWKNLLADIPFEPVPVEITVNNHYLIKPLNQTELDEIFMFDFIQKWFFDCENNENFSIMMEDINNRLENDDFDIDFENYIENYFDSIFNSEQKLLLSKRILMCAYLKYLSEGRPNAQKEGQIMCQLYNDDDAKNKLAKNILRKSIYEYYMALKFKYIECKKATNIFARKNKEKISNISPAQIEQIINIIECLWVR